MARRTIPMTEYSEILYRLNQGCSQRSIQKSLGICRKTIRKIHQKAQDLGFSPGISEQKLLDISAALTNPPKQKEAILPIEAHLRLHHEQIETWLGMPFMSKRQVLRLLHEDPYNLSLSETSLFRYLRKYFPETPNTTMVLPTIPGEQAQVDYGDVGKIIDAASGKLRKTYVFVMSLSHSRRRFACFVHSQNTQTWIDCHVKAFEFFGGVPHSVLLDNLKAGVIKPDLYDPVLNPAYAECARHYGFVADPAKVRTPEHKGKVERSVTIVKQQVVAGRAFTSLHEANTCALKWSHENAEVVCRTIGETPMERFKRDEEGKLKPLPDKPFECSIYQEAKVHRDQHVVFQGSFYSVPEAYVGTKVSLRVTARIVNIYHQYKIIKSHPRAKSKGQFVTDKADLSKGAQYFLDQTPARCLEDAKACGEDVFRLMEVLLSHSSTTVLRKAWAILRLAEKYGRVRLNAACARALCFDNTHYKAIEQILKLRLEEESLPKAVSPSNEGAYLRDPAEFIAIH